MYRECVPNVDDKGIGTGADGAPAATGEDLEATDLVLVEDGYGGRIGVGPRS